MQPCVIVAPEVAARIVAAHTAGTGRTALAQRWHLTLREVAQVVAAPTGCRALPGPAMTGDAPAWPGPTP